jgi:hypothetical protein
MFKRSVKVISIFFVEFLFKKKYIKAFSLLSLSKFKEFLYLTKHNGFSFYYKTRCVLVQTPSITKLIIFDSMDSSSVMTFMFQMSRCT